MVNDSLNRSEALKAEKSELDVLLGRGVEFEIVDVRLLSKFVAFFCSGCFKGRIRRFVIRPMVLEVMDVISAELLDMAIDKDSFVSSDVKIEAMRLVNANAYRCAKVVAIAVLGLGYKNVFELKRLTNLFYCSVTADKLLEIIMLVMVKLDLSTFTGAIGLIAGVRTSVPKTDPIAQK